MKEENLIFTRSMIYFGAVALSATGGLIADWMSNSLKSYKYFGLAMALGLFLPLIIFWVGDLIRKE